MHPDLFEINPFGWLQEPFALHSYGVLIAMGFMAAIYLARIQASRQGEDPDQIADLCFYLLLSGIVGGRIVYILTNLKSYMQHPWEIVFLWKGGLVFYGGFIGAVLFLIYYTTRYRISFLKLADLLVPSLALAHVFGRLGCLVGGCCYGKPTNLPWGIVFPKGSMPHQDQWVSGLIAANAPALPIHPTQLYEAGAELCLFTLLVAMGPYKRFHGQLFLIWLALYPIARTLIEMFRGDAIRGVWVLSTSQYISIAIGLICLILYFTIRPASPIPATGSRQT